MFLVSRGLAITASLLLTLGVTGCATYQGKVQMARSHLSAREFEKAVSELQPLAEKKSDDQLVYLLDYGVALQLAGDLQKSNSALLQADRLAEQSDYHSLSRVAGSLALNEEMVQYKGDTFEKVFINAYLAMNYLQMGQLDEALVEARRINEKYSKYRSEEKKNFELNFFGKYLSAMIWEASRNYDDAYIAYQEAYKIDSGVPILQEDLIRSAKLARRPDAYKSWKAKFPGVKEDPKWYEKKYGEVIVLFQQGWGPRKVLSANEYRFPALIPVYSETQSARITVDSKTFDSREVYNVQIAAVETLKEDQGLLLAKRLTGIATKAVLSDQLRQKNELLGNVAWIALNAMDRADLRQWSTLPETIQVAKIRLPPGKHTLSIEGLNSTRAFSGESLPDQEIEIKSGETSFIVWRSLK